MLDNKKFYIDTSAGFFSFLCLGLSGLALNALFTHTFSIEDFGGFSQVLGIYLICSQLATLGVPFSVTKHIAESERNATDNGIILYNAAMIVLVSSCVLSIILFISSGMLSRLFDSDYLAPGLQSIAPALVFFGLNKVILNGLNGLHKNVRYSLLLSLRYLLIPLMLLVLIYSEIIPERAPVIFLMVEFTLFIVLIYFALGNFKFCYTPSKEWISRHIWFGTHAIPNGIALTIITRTDVIILGLFTNDIVVGIYSIAALVLELFFQIPHVLRRVVDPILSREMYAGNIDSTTKIVNKLILKTFIFMLLLASLLIFLYPTLITLFTGKEDYVNSYPYILILLIGGIAFASHVPVLGLLIHSGRPDTQSSILIKGTVLNILLCLLLIPYLETYGAAISSSITFIYIIILYRYHTRMKLGILL